MAKYTPHPNQGLLFTPDSQWQTPTGVPNLANMPVIALDTETHDPDLNLRGPSWFRGGGKLVGVSLAWDGGNIYLPIRHEGGDNMAESMVVPWLRDLLKNFTGTLVLMNGFYDLGWLRCEGIFVNPAATLWDVMMAEALIDENKQKYNLASLAVTYGLPPKDEVKLTETAKIYGLDPKGDLWRLPARYVGPYAERDAKLTLEVYQRQQRPITDQRLERVLKLEHDLIPLLMEMRFRGVRVDVDKANQHLETFMAESEEHRNQIKSLTGYLPDIWSADSCAVAMDKVSIKYRSTSTGKPSFTDDWLSSFPEGTVPYLITKARKAYKAGQTFCKNMVIDQADSAGRVHCEFHPLRSDDGGTVSGRFSSSNPNLQQVPARDPRMNTLIRGLFLPEEDEEWCAADYSQQEPRLTIHYAEERGCQRGEEAAQRYRDDPNTDYHTFTAELTGLERKPAKTINLGLSYGMGGAKLCRSLGLPTGTWTAPNGKEYEVAGAEGKSIIDRYHQKMPFIKELTDHYTKIADEHGEIRTLSGRLCRFPFYEPLSGGRAVSLKQAIMDYGEANIKRAFTYRALNRKIQGGSADMIKVAMRDLWKEGLVPAVTVHDEIGISVASREVAKRVAEIMRTCVKLRVPLKVDVDLGKSWGEAKPMEEDDEQ